MRYIPTSPSERRALLASLGLERVETLFDSIPEKFRLRAPLRLPPAMAEADLVAHLRKMAEQNLDPHTASIFLGAGAYRHFAPAVVDHILSRAEFYSSYTPYQPEFSQGTLQTIFEFQTMICQLAGLDAANASLYDGASALAEGVLLAHRAKRRNRVTIAGHVHPEYLAVTRTLTSTLGVRLESVPAGADGAVDRDRLQRSLGPDTAAVVVQQPSFLGRIEEIGPIAEAAHAAGALCIVAVTEAVSMGLLKAPGDLGADVVLGEAQSFGVPLSFGGPYLGFMAVRSEWVRELPGRLVGQAKDASGRLGYVLTLATREQHIRRERATSNICTNEGLMMLAATVFMATLGKQGMRELALQNRARAEYARNLLGQIPGCRVPHAGPVFNEFVLELPGAAAPVHRRLLDQGVVAGLPLERYFPERGRELLICVTEVHGKAAIEQLAASLKEVL